MSHLANQLLICYLATQFVYGGVGSAYKRSSTLELVVPKYTDRKNNQCIVYF